MKRFVLVLATLLVTTSFAVAEEGNFQVEGAAVGDDVLLLVSGGQFPGDYGYTKAGTDAAEKICIDRLTKAEKDYSAVRAARDRTITDSVSVGCHECGYSHTSTSHGASEEAVENAKERVDGWRDALSSVHSHQCER